MPSSNRPQRTRKGLRKATCHLFHGAVHGSHRYTRGDERAVCPGRPTAANIPA